MFGLEFGERNGNEKVRKSNYLKLLDALTYHFSFFFSFAKFVIQTRPNYLCTKMFQRQEKSKLIVAYLNLLSLGHRDIYLQVKEG